MDSGRGHNALIVRVSRLGAGERWQIQIAPIGIDSRHLHEGVVSPIQIKSAERLVPLEGH